MFNYGFDMQMTTSKSSHVKDKNRIFTLYDKNMTFQTLLLQKHCLQTENISEIDYFTELSNIQEKMTRFWLAESSAVQVEHQGKKLCNSANNTSKFWIMIGWKATYREIFLANDIT